MKISKLTIGHGVGLAILLNIVALLALGFLFFVTTTQANLIFARSAEREILRADNQNQASVEKFLLESESARSLVAKYVVKEGRVADFLGHLESLALLADVVFKLESVSVEGEEASSLIIDFNAEGTFSNVHYLLSLYERLPHKIRFTAARISQSGDDGLWKAAVELILTSFVR